MFFFTGIIALFLAVYPPQAFGPSNSTYICEGDKLEATIYNNQDGSFKVLEPLEKLDAGAFAVLNWKDIVLMLPRTFNSGETSFTDGKWWWSYEDPNPPRFRRRNPLGDITDFTCDEISEEKAV